MESDKDIQDDFGAFDLLNVVLCGIMQGEGGIVATRLAVELWNTIIAGGFRREVGECCLDLGVLKHELMKKAIVLIQGLLML